MKKQKRIGMQFGAALAMTALLVALSGCEQKGPAEEAGEKIDEAVGQVGENMDNAAEQAGEQMEKAGEAVQDAAQGDK
jgi:predicted small lipoprotein YifL